MLRILLLSALCLCSAYSYDSHNQRTPSNCRITFENKGAFVLEISQEDVGTVSGVRRQAELARQSQEELRREQELTRENEEELKREAARRRDGMTEGEEQEELDREEQLIRERQRQLRREEALIRERQDELRSRSHHSGESDSYSDAVLGPRWSLSMLAGQKKDQDVHYQYPVRIHAKLGGTKTCNVQEFCGTRFTCWGTLFSLQCDC